MPRNVVSRETMQNALMTLLVTFKVGYPTDHMSIHSDPHTTPKGKFTINPDNYKVVDASLGGG